MNKALSVNSLKVRHVRRALWCSLLQLARGLKSLHDQNLIHRNVIPEAIWGLPSDGPESLRLGGFDWSARIGHAANSSKRNPWATPPELDQVGYSFISDWYGFGTTVARCFYRVEHLNCDSAIDYAKALASDISTGNPCNLNPLEKAFIKEVTAPDRVDRVQHAADIIERIERIIETLDFGKTVRNDGRRVLLHVDHRNPQLIDVAIKTGFIANPNIPLGAFDPASTEHQVRLKNFLVDQLRSVSLNWSLDGRRFELKCGSLFILGERWMDYGDSKEQSWKAAKVRLNGTTRLLESLPARGFDNVCIEIEIEPSEVNKKIGPGSGYTAWDTFAPKDDPSERLEHDSENLRQFLHVSNQFEILLRDAELFKYKIVNPPVKAGSTKIIIVPADEDRPSRKFWPCSLSRPPSSGRDWYQIG